MSRYFYDSSVNAKGTRDWYILREDPSGTLHWVADVKDQHYAEMFTQAANERQAEFDSALKESLEKNKEVLKKLADM